MNKKKIELIVTSLLLIVFVVSVIGSVKKIKCRQAYAKLQAVSSGVILELPSAATAVPPETGDKQLEFKDLEWGRDPFSDKIYLSKKAEIDLRITGILWDKHKPAAIINNRIAGIGDVIGKYTVMRIYKEKVILNDGSKNIEITIGK